MCLPVGKCHISNPGAIHTSVIFSFLIKYLIYKIPHNCYQNEIQAIKMWLHFHVQENIITLNKVKGFLPEVGKPNYFSHLNTGDSWNMVESCLGKRTPPSKKCCAVGIVGNSIECNLLVWNRTIQSFLKYFSFHWVKFPCPFNNHRLSDLS